MRKIKFRYVYRNVDTNEIKIVIKGIVQIEKDNEPYLGGWVLISRDEFTGLSDMDRTQLFENDIITTEICLMIVVWVKTTASFGAIPIKHYNELIDKNNIPTDNIYWFENDIVDFGIYGNIYHNHIPKILK